MQQGSAMKTISLQFATAYQKDACGYTSILRFYGMLHGVATATRRSNCATNALAQMNVIRKLNLIIQNPCKNIMETILFACWKLTYLNGSLCCR